MAAMVWGLVVGGQSCHVAGWCAALVAVTLGAAFSKCSTRPSLSGHELVESLLAFDGLTSACQEVLFMEYNVTKYNQMFYFILGSCFHSSS